MREQLRADAALLTAGAHVCVADQGDVLNVLDAHHASEGVVFYEAPEDDACVDLMLQLLLGHVGLGPAVCRDDAAIGLGAVVNDGPDLFEVSAVAAAYQCDSSLARYSRIRLFRRVTFCFDASKRDGACSGESDSLRE